ncbi:MAG: hypothetical protein AAF608_05205 [Pseudomonadota bacterium]
MQKVQYHDDTGDTFNVEEERATNGQERSHPVISVKTGSQDVVYLESCQVADLVKRLTFWLETTANGPDPVRMGPDGKIVT